MFSLDGYKLVMESNKVVIAKNNIFIGKGFIIDGLFKLNVLNESNENSSLILNIQSSISWHQRLGHVSNRKIKRLMDLNLIPKYRIDANHNCEICIQAK